MFYDVGLVHIGNSIIHYYTVCNSYFDKRLLFLLLVGYVKFSSADNMQEL